MTKRTIKEEDKTQISKLLGWGAIASVIIFVFAIATLTNSIHEKAVKDCNDSGKIWDKTIDKCREKNISEKFYEKCDVNIPYNWKGLTYYCKDLVSWGLKEAFVNDRPLIRHGDQLYELGSETEIAKAKELGKACLSASESWYHIGEKRCVVFRPTRLTCKGYCWLNEKKDYNNGFVAFFARWNMISWSDFENRYYSKNVLVCGDIITYNGHPEIKVYNVNATATSPSMSNGAYRYTCS